MNESIEAKLSAKRTREQLLSVIRHSHVTIFTTDHNGRVTMLEGALVWDKTENEKEADRWYLGQSVYTVFNRLTEHLPEGARPQFLEPINEVLSGKIDDGVSVNDHEMSRKIPYTPPIFFLC